MTGRAVSVAVRIVLWLSITAAIVLVGANATDVLNTIWLLPAAAVFIVALTAADKWCDRYEPTKPAVDWVRVAELEHDTGIYDLYTHAEEAGDVCRTCDDALLPPEGAFNEPSGPSWHESWVWNGRPAERALGFTYEQQPGVRVLWASLDPVPEQWANCHHPLNRLRDLNGPIHLYRCLDCGAPLTLGGPS
jgi:hypothetical protein